MAEQKKKKKNTVAVAEELVVPILEELGLWLWDVRFEKEGGAWFLRFFIDKEGGVNIDDCVAVSHAVEKRLDETDPIDQSYTLEVCSPGIERRLIKDWHYQAYIGKKVTVRLIRAVDGVREFVGVLEACEGDEVWLLLGDEDTEQLIQMRFLKSEAAFVKVFADFSTGGQES